MNKFEGFFREWRFGEYCAEYVFNGKRASVWIRNDFSGFKDDHSDIILIDGMNEKDKKALYAELQAEKQRRSLQNIEELSE